MATQSNSKILPLVLAAVVLLGAGAWFFTGGGSTETADTATTTQAGQTTQTAAVAQQTAPTGDGLPDMFQGSADAPVELIEYASYTCPHCARFHTDVYPKLKAEYIDTGKVKFILREVYFDQFGLAAGLLARCGGDMRYYGIADLLFEKQSEWARGEGDAVVQNLYRIGRQAGLQDDQMQACLSDKDKSTALVEDFRLKAGADDINATPSFVINGEKIANTSWEDLKSILDGKLN